MRENGKQRVLFQIFCSCLPAEVVQIKSKGGSGGGVRSGGSDGGSMYFSLESEFTHVTQDSRDHGAPLSYSKMYQVDEKRRHIGPVDSSSYQGIESDFERLST
ncbi:hypothetical protein Taro_053363 [Colocasia esculenta]|uniref:Uncharacterized protein n=1 Tax=Colocasia esculenta TaxID=4460 RepID=A0A843XMU5_COLES|nr:hypothetical protein [Colocasia esculenta]